MTWTLWLIIVAYVAIGLIIGRVSTVSSCGGVDHYRERRTDTHSPPRKTT